MASDEVNGLLALLDPAARDSVLGGTPELPARRSAGEAQAALPRPILQARTEEGRRARVDEVSMITTTRRALETQKEMKDSYVRQIDRYRVEIEKKYSIPLACVVFVLMGSPIAIRLGRSGMNTAIGLSVLVFLVYYVCLIGGEKLADRQIVSPRVAMWSPNVLFGIAGVLLARDATFEQRAVRFHVPSRLGFLRRFR
jgi:lipopolysaccharide export system permease protein